jgi:hypothetical protein
MPYLASSVSALDFGADPTGSTDSTGAINEALAYVATTSPDGGQVALPEGTFLVTPSSGVALSFTGSGSAGYQGVELVGSSWGATILSKQANGVAVQMSGPSTSPSTGSTHTRYCSLKNIQINGNNFSGAAIQCYYVDNFYMEQVFVNDNGDICLDSTEFWDSRIFNCIFGGSGSQTPNTAVPNVYLRNSSASSGFGNSTGTTNDIVIEATRFEAFMSGALWIAQGTGSSSGPNSIFVENCKMETSQLNGGSHLSVDANTRGAYVRGLYVYSGGFFTGYSTAQPTIVWSGQDSALLDVLVSNGGSATITNGVTVNSTVSGQNATLRNVTGTYSTAPTGSHIGIGTSTGGFVFDNCHSNETDPSPINSIVDVLGSASSTNVLGLSVGGDTVHRWVSNANGAFSYGSGSVTADVVTGRPVAGVWGVTTGSLLIGASDLGDNGVTEIKLANATTVPTTNPSGGLVAYANAGQLLARNPQGLVQTLSSIIGTQTSTTTVTGVTAETVLHTVTIPANDPAAGAVYHLTGYGIFTAASGNFTWTVRWGGTSGTSIAALPTGAAPALTNGLFYYDVLVTFRSTTSVTAAIKLDISSSISTDAATSYVGTPTSATAVTTTGSTALTVDITPSVSGDSISLLGGCARRLA